MRIYLAGPMRGYKLFNFPAFDEAKRKLELQGATVISPADIDRSIGIHPETLGNWDWQQLPTGYTTEQFIQQDIAAILTCDALYLLKGWQNSKGALAEKAIAEWRGILVMEYE